MKLHVRRIFSFAASLTVLVFSFAANVPPAEAAGIKLVVDEMGRCKGAFPTIQAALTYAQTLPAWATTQTKTITVCSGLYEGPISISGANNLKLIASKDVFVTVDGSNPYTGAIFSVSNSTGVTIQGFVVDGRGREDIPFGQAAISFSNTSGSILKNTIMNWHSSLFPSTRSEIDIDVTGTGSEVVTISGNTLKDIDTIGIHARNVKVQITGNTIATTSYSSLTTARAVVLDAGVTGSMSGNRLTGIFIAPAVWSMIGISLTNTNGMKVTGNKITNASTAIVIHGTGGTTDGNVVSGNSLTEVNDGIELYISTSFGGDGQGNNNQIVKNTIIDKLSGGHTAIYIVLEDLGGYHAYAQGELIAHNTITNFGTSVDTSGCVAPYCTGTFAPNTVR